ncbi:hypothetical protein [Saccharothrix luteola]|nr:hypothetical protein [Saccharothrix luteola]
MFRAKVDAARRGEHALAADLYRSAPALWQAEDEPRRAQPLRGAG